VNILEVREIGGDVRPLAANADRIELGQNRRAGEYVAIPLRGSGPYRAAKTEHGLVMATVPDSQDRYLVFRAIASYHRGDSHRIKDTSEGIEILAQGWRPWGEAGRLGGEPEYLIRYLPGAYIVAVGEWNAVVHYTHDPETDQWFVESTSEREARLAFAAEVIEWA